MAPIGEVSEETIGAAREAVSEATTEVMAVVLLEDPERKTR